MDVFARVLGDPTLPEQHGARPGVQVTVPLSTLVYRVAPSDPELLRAVARRINALDPVESLAEHRQLLNRAESLYREGAAAAPEIPPRSTLLAALEQS